MPVSSRSALHALLSLGILLISACAAKSPDRTTAHMPPASLPDKTAVSSLADARRIVVRTALDSIDTPYAWGGHDPDRGFDCSGLVFYAHQKAGVRVPRTAADQFRNGKKVSSHNLAPGDLVFFNAPKKPNSFHVGIFTGSRYFVHAPGKGRQVMRASLDNPYFKKHFKGVRTYL